MWSVLGLEFFHPGERCQVADVGPKLEILPEFLFYSLICTSLFHSLRVLTDRVYHSSAVKHAKRETHRERGKRNDQDKNNPQFQECVNKFLEEAWKWKVTLFLTVFGLSVVVFSGWVSKEADIRLWHTRYPQHTSRMSEWYYRLSFGYHSYRTWTHFNGSARRKDFVALIVHHWCTLFLILISLCLRVTEVGVLVMIIHDNTDLFLSLAKFLNYQRIRYLKDVCFALFAISWIFGRCLAYSIFVLWPFLLAKQYSCHYLYYLIGVALFTLFGLHVWWLRFLIPALMSVFLNGEVKDTRSDSDDSSKDRKNR